MAAPVWHALLAPLPPDARVSRSDVGAPGAAGDTLAGWTQWVLELSAGTAGLRIIVIVLDRAGTPLTVTDTVLRTTAVEAPPNGESSPDVESISGRLLSDGSFQGTRWKGETPSPPTEQERADVMALVADVVRLIAPAQTKLGNRSD